MVKQDNYLHERGATDFDAIKLSIASPDKILEWSHGKVTKPETINYRTQKPEKDGLFCERIFGPTKDWECYCGKYKGTHYRGVICDRCGVLVTRSIVRRERMGHIELAVPVTHVWFLRGTASTIGLILNMTGKDLEKVAYFASYVISEVDEKKRKTYIKQLEDTLKKDTAAIKKKFDTAASKKNADIKKLAEDKGNEQAELEEAHKLEKSKLDSLKIQKLLSEGEYKDIESSYPDVIKAEIGAKGIQELLQKIDLNKITKSLTEELAETQGQRRRRLLKRLKMLEGMRNSKIRPEWMVIQNLPVIPPDLRPMVQLPGGRFATSDLNDLYRRVINRNNRLKKLLDINAPEVIRRNEMRMLQEAVDALIDNSHTRGGRAVSSTGGRRKLKSLSDMLRGKQGRFRQNLLGKRVDYSGRSVIVAGPELTLDECGLPKMMAVELFKPFIIGKLIDQELAHNVKMAGRMIEQGEAEVWDALDEVIKNKYVLLNRAPTLHRLGVQAFKPVLVEGKAIQLHPLVCLGFNADFDGDQMAVHLPLSKAAQAEAKMQMSAIHNLIKPADGNSIIYVAQDMVLGIYYATYARYKDEPKVTFSSKEEADFAFMQDKIRLQTPIKAIVNGELITTTYGRLLFNEVLPEDLEYMNEVFDADRIEKLLTSIFDKYGEEVTAKVADRIKDMGFYMATKSALSTGADDFPIPPEKSELLKQGEEKVSKISDQYQQGLISNEERYRLTIAVWRDVTDKIRDELEKHFVREDNSTYVTVVSKARASLAVVSQIAGMRGLTQDVYGETIELPIKSNYKEGLSPLEYFSSARGSRKGLVDTALRTADAGYLTRRLVDVAQDVFTTEEDCGDTDGVFVERARAEESGQDYSFYLAGRIAASTLHGKGKKLLAKRGDLISKKLADEIAADESIKEVNIRSVLSCLTLRGICRTCYGVDLGKGDMVGLRVPVGVIAAQAVGEPGTQLTLRTFHKGGVAEEDITHGLPRVEELFEARNPKGEAVISEIEGRVTVKKVADANEVIVQAPKNTQYKYALPKGLKPLVKDKDEVQYRDILAASSDGRQMVLSNSAGVVRVSKTQITVRSGAVDVRDYKIPSYRSLLVKDGEFVKAGQALTAGSINLQDLLKVTDESKVYRYIMDEIQAIYNMQGATIADKHLEVIVRQMLSRVQIEDPGGGLFVTGDVVSLATAVEENQKLMKERKQTSLFKPLLLGVAKVASWSDSFLSAASFQDTTRVLISAATQGRIDRLYGLKENVIIGRQIPVGTGFHGVEIEEDE